MLAVVAVGCRADVDIAVEIDETGAGRVRVAVSVDADVVAAAPDIDELFRLDDVRAAGWAVTVADAAGGGRVVSADKTFASIDDLDDVLAELDGSGTLVGQSDMRIRREVGTTTYRASLTLDLSGGLGPFSDPDTATRLDGELYGVPVAELEDVAGAPLADLVGVSLSATLLDERARVPDTGRLAVSDGGRHVLEVSAIVVDEAVVAADADATAARDALPGAVRLVVVWWLVLGALVLAWLGWRRFAERA